MCPQQSQLPEVVYLELWEHVVVEAAAKHGRHRRRQAAGRLRRVVEAGATVEPLGRRRLVLVGSGGALVSWAHVHRHHRLALPACCGGRGRREHHEIGAVVADGQELVEGRVHGERGVVGGHVGRGVQDLRERVLVPQQLGDGGDLGEPRQRRRLLVLLHDDGRRRSSVCSTSSSSTAADGRRGGGVQAGAAAEVVVEEAAGRRSVAVEVLVVGERRHHRRRVAGLLVDPAQHPVVQPHGDVPELGGRAVGGEGAGAAGDGGEAVLVHDPVGLGAPGRAALVEDERLLDADALAGGGVVDGLVGAGGLPVAGAGGAVGADAVGVLAVPRAEEVVLAVAVQRLGRQVPWVELVDVDVGDDGHGARRRRGAVAEVVQDELLVRRVEPEPRRQLRRRRLRCC
uniref:Uncharacterized protein n=1 Tax=Zea mays TaxID=4577 RepID=C0PHZ5_MAIZE|nr:unknown [Zea mays]